MVIDHNPNVCSLRIPASRFCYRGSLPSGDFVEERLVEADARFEVGDGEVFVGRMGVAVGEGEAEEEGVDAEDFGKALDRRGR